MPYSKIPFQAGIYKDDSPLEAKGYWVDADKIRFVRGLPETIYGWERASTSTLLGICRGSLTWADNGRNPYAAFGTHLRAYAIDVDGNVTGVTPVASRTAAVSISFTTTIRSAVLLLSAAQGELALGEAAERAVPAVPHQQLARAAVAKSSFSGVSMKYGRPEEKQGDVTHMVAVLGLSGAAYQPRPLLGFTTDDELLAKLFAPNKAVWEAASEWFVQFPDGVQNGAVHIGSDFGDAAAYANPDGTDGNGNPKSVGQ